MFPLLVEAIMAEGADTSSIQEEVAAALKGICGAPRSDEIKFSRFTGKVDLYLQPFLEKEIPEIRKRLESCSCLDPDPKKIRIVETTIKMH